MNTFLPSTTGRVLSVGAGPGNPDLLMFRAHEILVDTAIAYVDVDVMLGVRELITTGVPVPPELLKEAEKKYERMCAAAKAKGSHRKPPRPALPTTADLHEPIDDPKKMAELLVEEAAKGSDVVRSVAGNPLTNDSLLAEVNGISHAEVESRAVLDTSVPPTVSALASAALGSTYTKTDLGRVNVDRDELAQAPQPLMLQAVQNDLFAITTELDERGLPSSLPISAIVNGTARLQRTCDVTLGILAQLSGDLTGPLVVTLGKGVDNHSKYSWWENRALYGWKVPIPRARAQAGPVSAHPAGYNAISIETLTISIEPPRSPVQMERAIKGLVNGHYRWVVLIPVNTATAVREKFQEFGSDVHSFAGIRIVAAGRRTTAAIRSLGITPELLPDDTCQNATGVVGVFPEYIKDLDPINRVLLLRADIGTGMFVDGLTNLGWEIDDMVVYHTMRTAPLSTDIRDMAKSGGLDAACFTPGSTVKNLVGIAGKLHACTTVTCIGSMAAIAAHEYSLRADVVPKRANISGLVGALAEHVAQLRAVGQLPPLRGKRCRSRKTRG